MKKMFVLVAVLISLNLSAQELFVFTEPASNMPAKSVGIRDMNSFMFEKDGMLNYHNMPELMWGINKKWMVHVQGFISNRQDSGLQAEGGSFYAKYRFLSKDELQNPFDENFDIVFAGRKNEADEFYNNLMPENISKDVANIQRQVASLYSFKLANTRKGQLLNLIPSLSLSQAILMIQGN